MRIAQGRIIDPSLTRRVYDPLKEASKQTADSNGGTWSLMLSLTDVCVGLLLDDLYFHRSPKKDRPNLSSTVFLSSGLVSATSGKSFSHSYRLQRRGNSSMPLNPAVSSDRESLTSIADDSAHLEIPVDPFERS